VHKVIPTHPRLLTIIRLSLRNITIHNSKPNSHCNRNSPNRDRHRSTISTNSPLSLTQPLTMLLIIFLNKLCHSIITTIIINNNRKRTNRLIQAFIHKYV